jgi:hypothetical protein
LAHPDFGSATIDLGNDAVRIGSKAP